MERIKKLSDELVAMQQQASRLSWTQYTTGYDFGIAEMYNKINEKIMNKDDFEYIKMMHEREDLSFEDKRRCEIMYKMYEPSHLSPEINAMDEKMHALTTKLSQVLNTFRNTIDGVEVSSVDISEILRDNPDEAKRKEAFLARTQINEALVDAGFIDLIKMRKEYAKLRGYDNYVEMKLADQGLNTDMFKTWKDELHEMLPAMKAKKAEVAKKYLDKDEIKPWDTAYLVSKMAPSLNKTVDMTDFFNVLRNFYLKFGIDISECNITYDIFPRANKSQWGYNFPIATRKDTRILANVKNNYSEYRTLLHETGHGIHSYWQDPEEEILNSGISGIITEGLANLFGSFLYDDMFMNDFFGDDKQVREELKLYQDYAKVNSLNAIVDIMFDQKLYTTEINTLEDINKLAFDTYKEYLDEDPYAEQFPWGFRIHHTTHPIYLHNYFMGDVTCEMLKKKFVEKYNCEKVSDKPKEFVEFIKKEIVEPSGLYKYPELFKRISGEEFSLKYMK